MTSNAHPVRPTHTPFLILALVLLSSCWPQKQKSNQPEPVILFLEASVPHIDPIHSTNKYSSTLVANIFEGLYHYQYLTRPIQLEPLLAADMPQVSSDGLTYTIKIRPQVFFHDDPAFGGKERELTAEDFIFSWRRLADPMNKALGWWVLDDLIVGLNHWRDQLRAGKADYQSPIEGLKALDRYTLQIRLTRPSFQLLHFLAMPVTMVVAPEVVKHYGTQVSQHPIGTGAYRLESWSHSNEVVFLKNKKYRNLKYPQMGSAEAESLGLLKDAGQTLPLTEQVIVKIITEKQPLWLSFLKGQLDVGSVPIDNFRDVFENNKLRPDYEKKGIRIYSQARPDVTMIAFNMEHPLLGKNKHLRKAFAHALDKKLILEQFYNNRGLLAQGPIPPQLPGYNPDYKNPIQYDLVKAKEELLKAGYPDGKGLPVFDFELSSNATWSRQMGELLKDLWGRVGIKIRLVANTWPQFDQKIKNKTATLFEMAWSADYPDSENFLQLFYSKNISPGSNNSNFIHREYDRLFEKALALPAGPQRDLLDHQMVEFINEEIPTVFMYHRTFTTPYHSWLKNYYEHPIVFDYFKYLKIDQKIKIQQQVKL